MKQYITSSELKKLSAAAQERLEEWFVGSIEWDDDPVYVYIPLENKRGHPGIFKGQWDSEREFTYPERYTGKIKNHSGTILPLLDITQMLEFLEVHDQTYKPVPISDLCDSLWEQVKTLLEKEA